MKWLKDTMKVLLMAEQFPDWLPHFLTFRKSSPLSLLVIEVRKKILILVYKVSWYVILPIIFSSLPL